MYLRGIPNLLEITNIQLCQEGRAYLKLTHSLSELFKPSGKMHVMNGLV